jgi:hypothetical protein
LVVAPALNTRLAHSPSGDDAAARRKAEQRLARAVATLAKLGLHPRGEVADADPVLALQDALVSFAADEVIIATHPTERSNWLERGVVERAQACFQLPVTHIVIHADIPARTATSR